MINHIKVSNHKGLVFGELTHLGNLNVICGKNNSGKTTILEAIDSNIDEKVGFGVEFDNELIQKFYKDILRRTSFKENHELKNQYYPMLKRVFESRKIWYSNNGGEFIKSINSEMNRLRQRNWGIDGNTYLESYKNVFPEGHKIVLIPPKRNLPCDVKIETRAEASPNGLGVINSLFSFQTKGDMSRERDFFNRLSSVFEKITSDFKFEIITSDKIDNYLFLKFSYKDQESRNASDCGLGLLDLITILYFSLNPNYDLVLIEEPENHMHPEMQRKLLDFLKNKLNLSKQFIFSTHSNVYLDESYIDRIFLSHYDNIVKIEDVTSKAKVLSELGYSITDNLVSDLILLVEGPNDKKILNTLLNEMGVIENFKIKYWFLSGDTMAQVDLTTFVENHRVIALIDKDPESKKARDKFNHNCDEFGIECKRLDGYSIENYIPLELIKQLFPEKIPVDLEKIDFERKLEPQLCFPIKRYIDLIAQNLKLKDVEGTDLYEFILRVKEICEKG